MNTPNNYPNNINSNNAISLLTAKPAIDNKAYIVDKRLVDILLAGIVKVDFDVIKSVLTSKINSCTNKQEMFDMLDEYIYMDQIVTKLDALEPKEEQGLGNAVVEGVPVVGKIDLTKQSYEEKWENA